MSTQDIVQKLWNLCHVLRDDGITYHQYVTELTYLLFLKMMEELGREEELPDGNRWADLKAQDGEAQLNFYNIMLLNLRHNGSASVKTIYDNASSSLRYPVNLNKLITQIDQIDWYDAKEEGLGDLYEGLLERNAAEKRSGAGQYFTPRPLVDCMIHLTQPQYKETVVDPATGTGGFLIRAHDYVFTRNQDNADDKFYKITKGSFFGMELVHDTHRLSVMNALLHDIDGRNVRYGDTLGPLGANLPKADVVLSNPPFGTKRGGEQAKRDDLLFKTSNKQLNFLQHIYRSLIPGTGRAAVVLPDNVLFEDGVGRQIRADLMDKCNLHTILRLPTGIFYAQGVKTNVLFFCRGEEDKNNTQNIWFYDMRTDMPSFGKRTPLTREHFAEFEQCFGDDRYGGNPRVDQGEDGRFRVFSREVIRERGDSLDVSWLGVNRRNESSEVDPEKIVLEISRLLNNALTDVQEIGSLISKDWQ